MLIVTGPGQSVSSYKLIHSLWLPLLGLGVWGRAQAVHQGRLSVAPRLGAHQQKSQGTLMTSPWASADFFDPPQLQAEILVSKDLSQGCQTHFHQGQHQPQGCLQMAECNFRTV